MIAVLLRGLALSSPPQVLALLLGVVYVLLILKRQRRPTLLVIPVPNIVIVD